MGNERILFAVNIKSGASENEGVEESIRDEMTRNNIVFEIFLLSGDNLADRLADHIRKYKPGIVVAAGGDGTINLIASVILNQNIKLGIIPIGSANGLASELGIPNRIKDALQLILNGNPRPFDVIRINEQNISLHLSDVGINARIIKEFEKEGKRGLKAYFKHFVIELVKPQPAFLCTIVANGRMFTHRAYMTLIANCNKYGTGAVINPSGKWDDGEFELIVIRPHKNWILKSLIGAVMGTFHLQPHIEVYKCTSAVISVMPAQDLQVDGEILGKVSEIKTIIEPQALQVICQD